MWRSRIFWKLFGALGTLSLICVIVLGAVIIDRAHQVFLKNSEQDVRARAALVAELVRGRSAEALPELQKRMEALARETATRITLLAADGSALVDSQEDPRLFPFEDAADRLEVQIARDERVGVVKSRYSNATHQEMMFVAQRTDDSGAVAFVRVALPLDAINGRLAKLRGIVWTVALAAELGALALAFWLARRVLPSVSELTAAAGRIASGDYAQKVFTSGQDELATLALTFNRMSEQLRLQLARLQDDRQQLRTILGAMVEGVIAMDSEQRILFVNDRAAELLHFQIASAVGRKVWEVVRNRNFQRIVRQALEEKDSCQGEVNWNGAASKSLIVHAARLPEPSARGAVLVLHDTTELRRLERVRQEFVANVSHELKTPLAVIKACVETLLDGAVDDSQNRGRFLQQIAEQSDRLHALILDLLSLARIESGAEIFEFQAVAVGPLVSRCIERHRARAQGNNQALTEVAPDQSLTAWGDEESISQILENLVDNALKYTPAGGAISVCWGAEEGNLQLEVKDTGIGIPEHDLPRIFERFYRVDKARSRELGGTGLGLSIVKHLVQAMDGSIQATSRFGEGSSFCVRLPRAPSPYPLPR